MGNKLTDLRDTRFVLYEQLKVEDLCQAPRFQDHSRETFEMIITAAEKLAVNDFEPTNSIGDKIGCQWRTVKSRFPNRIGHPSESFAKAVG